MNCSYCDKELTNYIQSAKIPDTENSYYIACRNCGNVMKSDIVDGSIIVLQSTSTIPGPQTEKEIALAKELFAESGFRVQSYSVDPPKSPGISHKNETENRSESLPEQSEIPVKKKRSFLAKIRDFCKRLF